MAALETIDIEALLIRAYYEKQIHLLGLSDTQNRRTLGRLIGLHCPAGVGGWNVGERVQSSSYAEKRAARERELMARLSFATDSLIALHDAVLNLPTFWLEAEGGLDFTVWDAETALQLGHRIEPGRLDGTVTRMRRRGGADKRADELRPAGPARRVVPIVATTLMVTHGRGADRPFVPDVVVTRTVPRYAGGMKQAVAREPEYETALPEVVRARGEYAVWHACLGILAGQLAGAGDLVVTGPAAPAAPWDLPADERAPGLAVARRSRRPKAVRATEKNVSLAIG